MILFSVICLVIIMFGVQHLLNWMWRNVKEDTAVPAVILTIFSIIVTCVCVYHILLWGKEII